jgi:hypothetical protein
VGKDHVCNMKRRRMQVHMSKTPVERLFADATGQSARAPQ